jgi:large subunit ribosomal protein L11
MVDCLPDKQNVAVRFCLGLFYFYCMISKKIRVILRFKLPASQAKSAAILTQKLGPYGVNTTEFCNVFNEKSKIYEEGVIIPVLLYVYTDKKFDMILKLPQLSVYLKAIADIDKGSYNTYISRKRKRKN